MKQNDQHNETEMRRFLLGEMHEDERSAFEKNFVADEELFEKLRVCEDELIESYVRGTLKETSRKEFEKCFLTTAKRRERVDFTRRMIAKLPEFGVFERENEVFATRKSSILSSIIELFKTPKFAFGTAFAILLLIFGGWVLLRNPVVPQNEIAGQIKPIPTVQKNEQIPPDSNLDLSENENVSVKSNVAAPEKNPVNTNKKTNTANENSEKPKQKTVESTPFLALFAGSVRSEGKMSELQLPENASGANLQLNLESQDYKIYQIEIVDPDGRSIFQNQRLKAEKSKINFFVPAQKLRKGDYIIKVSALNAQNENESVADYFFRVDPK